MANNLNTDARKWVLKEYWKSQNAETVRTKWVETFGTQAPKRQTIYRIPDKFDATGSILNAQKTGRPKTVCTEDNKQLVAEAFVHSPKKSTRRASAELDISQTSIIRILKSIGLKAYRPKLIHGLLEDDPDRRLQFSEIMLNEIEENPIIADNIVWTDEASFKLSGHVNRHNCVYWYSENMHLTLEQQLNQPGVTVWGGISSSGVLGPIFFDGTVTGDKYLEILMNEVVPQLQQQPNSHELYFHQDGAPPHYSRAVRAYLDETFPEKWIGRRGPIDWPARSPDFTPMDFFFWGVLKDKVYSLKPRSVGDLKNYIRDAFQGINAQRNLCKIVCRSVKGRLQSCVNCNGQQFEHLR